MAMLGPALFVAEVLGNLAPESKASKESTNHEENQVIVTSDRSKRGSIVHHFKLVETRTREGEYQEDIDQDSANLKSETTKEDGKKTSWCECFGSCRKPKAGA